jgi:hypothetical protein
MSSTTESAATIVTASSDGSKSKRPSYTLKEKRAYIAKIECLLKSGLAKRPHKACTSVGLDPRYYKRWKKQVATQEQLKADQSTVPFNISYTCRKIHAGRPSLLDSISGQLERYIFELREQGIQVTTRAVKVEDSKLSSAFHAKSVVAKKKIVERFVKRVGLTHRVGTHVAQKNHEETAQESKDFIAHMGAITARLNPADVLNMDQTPIPYSYHARTTLATKGSKTVHVRASTGDTKRTTLAAAVTGDGKLLTPMLIFKGERNGRIAQKQLHLYPKGCIYACQPKAWMDEGMMYKWMEEVLQPWVDESGLWRGNIYGREAVKTEKLMEEDLEVTKEFN